jgi:hypothetical protein
VIKKFSQETENSGLLKNRGCNNPEIERMPAAGIAKISAFLTQKAEQIVYY